MPSLVERDGVIVAHSHLRWDFVWQRPQQVLSRFADTTRVIFVEEARYSEDPHLSPRLDLSTPVANVTRVVPVLPSHLRDHYDEAVHFVRSRLAVMVRSASSVVQWFYTPMPAPVMLGALEEAVVVYDCMDELAAFRFAPPDLEHRERILLSRADVVFTGGARLFASKSRLHGNVHFLGCGVDASHFARSRMHRTSPPPDVAALARPVFGYVGVIDERLDYRLLRDLARAHPRASIVMVGPRVKIDAAALPAEPNMHWLGQRAYDELPPYLAAFDVCLMPFALNEATRYINPTKTLEYMAAGKPIVSTAVADVVTQFASIVHIARTRRQFIGLCEAAVCLDQSTRVAAGLARATRASWDTIVSRMQEIIAAVHSTNDQHGAEPVVA
jgi:glycosyltransferase involved in cell wall biosynthesis